MPFTFLIIGLVMLVSAVRGTYTELINLVSGEFKGSTAGSNFMYWLIAILILGMIGYVDSLRTFSRTVMALVIIVLLLHNSGFFSQFFGSIGASPASIDTTLGNIAGTPGINVLSPAQTSSILGG